MSLHEAVLTAIREKNGEWVSGEALSQILNVSRTTVWKQVKALQAQGYEVQTSPKKGYRLCALPDILSPQEVCFGLKTEVFGRENYIYLPEIDSTNNHAKHLANEGYPEGTVVVTERQTAGRGRRGRNWFSPAGQGIYVSLILRPVLPLKDISRVSLVVAAAVAETLEVELNLPAHIKWPNDILINNRKIAGILTEAVTDMDSVEYIVTGVGLNINNQGEDFPDDFRTPATSIQEEYAGSFSRVKLLQGLLMQLEHDYHRLLDGDFASILEKVRSLSMVIGQDVRLDEVNGLITGRAIDIDGNGFLVVRDPAGITHTVMSGEILVLPPRQ